MPKRMIYSAITGAVLFIVVLFSKPELPFKNTQLLFGAIVMAIVTSAGGSFSFLMKKAFEKNFIPQLAAKIASIVGFMIFAMAGFLFAMRSIG